MDSVYKYGYCHRYRPGKDLTTNTGEPDPLEQQKWSNGWTQNWCPSDNRENWENRKHLSERQGWTDNNVRYRHNQWGFRHTGDFVENRNSIVFLGCSLTYGIGVNYEQTWTYYVSKELGLDCINLAQPGTAINASYRVAKYWLPIIKPKAVMFYVPDHHRRELWPNPDCGGGEDQYADSVKSIGHWHSKDGPDSKYFEYWNMVISKRETDIWRKGQMDAMNWICKDTKYFHFPVRQQTVGRIVEFDLKTQSIEFDGNHEPDTDYATNARDMIHPGPVIHRENIAPLFIKAYNES